MKRRHRRKALYDPNLLIVYAFLFFTMLISALLPVYMNNQTLIQELTLGR